MAQHLGSNQVIDSDVLIGSQLTTPDVKLHVIEGGTKATPLSQTVAALQSSANSTDSCFLNIISGTIGAAGVHFGDTAAVSTAYVQWDNSNDSLQIGRSGGLCTFFSDGATITGTSSSQVMQTTSGNRITSSNDLPLVTTIGGSGTGKPRVGGMLYEIVSSTNNVTTGEDDLLTYTMPASTLSREGDRLLIHATGAFSNNSETKTLKFYIGGTYATLVNANVLGKHWDFQCWIARRSTATDVERMIRYTHADAATLGTPDSYIYSNNITIGTLASNQVIKFTGEATSTGAISQFSMCIIYYPAYDA